MGRVKEMLIMTRTELNQTRNRRREAIATTILLQAGQPRRISAMQTLLRQLRRPDATPVTTSDILPNAGWPMETPARH